MLESLISAAYYGDSCLHLSFTYDVTEDQMLLMMYVHAAKQDKVARMQKLQP